MIDRIVEIKIDMNAKEIFIWEWVQELLEIPGDGGSAQTKSILTLRGISYIASTPCHGDVRCQMPWI